jgi:hypothetical protein
MHGFSDEFMEFLKTNHTTDYYKAMADDVKPETLSRIYGDYNAYFNIWEKVPYAIRQAHGGIVPAQIMELAAEGKTEILRDIAQGKRPEPQEPPRPLLAPPPPAEIMESAFFAAAISAGYSHQCSLELAGNRMLRDSLREKIKTGILTAEEKTAWHESRKRDRDAIKKDWCNCQPEKMLVRLFAEYNRGKISKEELLPQAAELIQKIDNDHRRDHLLEYLNSDKIQAKLSHFRRDVIDTFSKTILYDIPHKDRHEYLVHSIPLKMQLRRLSDDVKNGKETNPQQRINDLVKEAQKSGVGVDLSNYGGDSPHQMSAELRQMIMVACCVNNVAFRSPNGERVNLNSDYVKKLPENIQAMVTSRAMRLANESMVKQTGEKHKHNLVKDISNIVNAAKGQRESA